MEITFLGTGVAIPQKNRVQSGMLVRLEEKPLLVDCGSGVLNRFPETGISHTEVDTVLLSHLHLDHVADLHPLIKANWLRGNTSMKVYGPEGTEEWFSKVIDAYEYLQEEVDVDIIELAPFKIPFQAVHCFSFMPPHFRIEMCKADASNFFIVFFQDVGK